MSNSSGGFGALADSYSRTARLTPGMLMLIGPAAVMAGAGVNEWPIAATLVSVVVTFGLPVAMADWVRRRGQRLQSECWAKKGNPLVADLKLEGLVAEQRRQALASSTGLPVDDLDREDYDAIAMNALKRLMTVTRDPAVYPLVLAENKAYGFARNLLAVRPVGLALSVSASIVGLTLVILNHSSDTPQFSNLLVGSGVALCSVAFWFWFPNKARLLAADRDYRGQLLATLDTGALPRNQG